MSVENNNEEMRLALAELSERRAADAVQERVEKTLIKRYSWLGLIIAVLTGGVIAVLVKSNVDTALLETHKNIAASQAIQERSDAALIELDKSLKRMKALEQKVSSLAGKADGVEIKFKEIESYSVSIRRDQYASSIDVLEVSGKLEERITEIEKSVAELSIPAEDREKLVEALDRSKEIEAPVQKARLRAEKRRYPIQLSGLPKAKKLIEALSQSGFTASIYNEFSDEQSPKSNEAIWVGKSVPYKDVVEIIKIALTYFPNLKYASLSGDHDEPPEYVHSEMFLGGTTFTAEEEGLRELPTKNLPVLFDEISSKEELHEFIRSYYGETAEKRE